MNRIYPVGIQNFEEIRKGNYCYVDKTALIHRLVYSGKYYFLSRPRRFGKSLLISTLEAYFQGKKELFNGLAMETLEKDWTVYPVLHLDLNNEKYDSPDKLDGILHNVLCRWEEIYGKRDSETSLSLRFQGIIQRASEKTGHHVVILIDEYDKPMLQALGDEALLTDYRNTLKAFYGTLKSCDQYIKFALLTGVTKFSKVSVFSDLNNLMDISIDDRFTNLCGITEEELYLNFQEDIIALGENNGMTSEEAKSTLKKLYDGYHFAGNSDDIYNPFSLLNTFAKMRFGSYWFETGTPTFLVELLKRSKYNLHRLTEELASADCLGGIDSMNTNPVPILYQSGYLTIKDYEKKIDVYTLDFPNKEIEVGLFDSLLPGYLGSGIDMGRVVIADISSYINSGKMDEALQMLADFLETIPYCDNTNYEGHYQQMLYIIFALLTDYNIIVEQHTAKGRIDITLETADTIYVMELKFNKSAEEALAQIEARQYADAFKMSGKKVVKVGLNFSIKDEVNTLEWVIS